MIGQTELQPRIYTMIQSGIYPRFSILEGETGSGKRTMAKYIAEQLGAIPVIITDLSVNSVREVINNSYKTSDRCCYIFPEADSMSIGAKNSLLKITEEAPNNAYIIMTLVDRRNMLDTIISRATVLPMDKYCSSELMAFIEAYCPNIPQEERTLVLDLAETPGDVLQLQEIGAQQFYDYVEKVYYNIAEVSGANSFKIAAQVALKDTDTGYPLDLFWRAFMKVCTNHFDINDIDKNVVGVSITGDALKDLRIKGINKKMLMDSWILNIRERWME